MDLHDVGWVSIPYQMITSLTFYGPWDQDRFPCDCGAMWNSNPDSRLNLACIILSQNKQKWGNIRVTILLFRYNFIIVYTVMKMWVPPEQSVSDWPEMPSHRSAVCQWDSPTTPQCPAPVPTPSRLPWWLIWPLPGSRFWWYPSCPQSRRWEEQSQTNGICLPLSEVCWVWPALAE